MFMAPRSDGWDIAKARRLNGMLTTAKRNGRSLRDVFNYNLFRFKFPYLGLKWCGTGNIADSYNDLGYFAAEDSCCRAHDHCFFSLPPNYCLFNGVGNSSKYTMSHYQCDLHFKICLEMANTFVANVIQSIYEAFHVNLPSAKFLARV